MNVTTGRLLQNVGYLYTESEMVKEQYAELNAENDQLRRSLENVQQENTGLTIKLQQAQEEISQLKEAAAKKKTSGTSNR